MNYLPDLTFLNNRDCPSCGSTEIDAKEIVSFAETLSLDEIKNYWSGFFKKNIFFTYSRCRQCGLLYCKKYFTEQTLNYLYSNMSDNTAGLPLELMRQTQNGYFKMLDNFSKSYGTYGEIGPDIGLFTKHVANTGRFTDFFLWEPNSTVHGRLKDATNGLPSQIFNTLTTISEVPDQSLDLMVIVHVLDHLPSCGDFLTTLRNKMKPQGKVFVITHNEKSVIAKIIGRSWPAYCLQHPQLFNPKSMTELLTRHGFRVDTIKRTTNYFPINYLLKHFFWAFRMQIDVKLFRSLSLPIKLGNIATIATVI